MPTATACGVGDFRVFFEFDGDVRIIDIEEVKKTR